MLDPHRELSRMRTASVAACYWFAYSEVMHWQYLVFSDWYRLSADAILDRSSSIRRRLGSRIRNIPETTIRRFYFFKGRIVNKSEGTSDVR
jgi:hypothetical protein